VQGVGFRRFVLYQAQRLELRGFVCNLEDGAVECVAQGNSEALTEFEMLLRQGPRNSTVTNLVCTDEGSPRKYTTFRII